MAGDRQVRLGIIGLGRVFWLGYLPWLSSYLEGAGDVRLAAVCDSNEALRSKYSEMLSCKAYTDARELMDSGEVDAVIINTPTWTHRELTVAAAGAGLHVLCEKPMAATVAECDRMLEACQRAGVLLRISFMRRFNRGFQKVRELVRAGSLGELVELEAEWPYFIPDIDQQPYAGALSCIKRVSGVDIPEKYGAWRLKDPRVGGGDFLDHGPHLVDFFRWVAGDITHVTAESRSMVPGRNEDFTCCHLRFAGGAAGRITTTLYDHRSGLTGKVYFSARGTRGRVDLVLPNTDKFKPVRHLTFYREPDSSAGKLVRALGYMRGRKIRLPANLVFLEQLEDLVASIRGERPAHPVFGGEALAATGEDGRYTINVVELCYRSAELPEPTWLPVR